MAVSRNGRCQHLFEIGHPRLPFVAPESRSRTPDWSFGNFELDSQTGELRRSGFLVRLAPQTLRVLVALLERPGDLVTRAELRQLLWDDQTFVEFDRSLNFCLSRRRGALGDDARRPRFVETLQGRGYRFIAPVQIRALPEPRRQARVRPRLRLAAVAAALVLGFCPRHIKGSSAARRPKRSTGTPGRCAARMRRRSVDLYREALARDPAFAAAHAGLAESYLALGEGAWLTPAQAFPPAEDAARRALALAERPDAHLVLGRALLAYQWDWAGSERELRQALALDPSSVQAWVSLARLHSARGEHERAIVAAQHAEALDPAAPEAIEQVACATTEPRVSTMRPGSSASWPSGGRRRRVTVSSRSSGRRAELGTPCRKPTRSCSALACPNRNEPHSVGCHRTTRPPHISAARSPTFAANRVASALRPSVSRCSTRPLASPARPSPCCRRRRMSGRRASSRRLRTRPSIPFAGSQSSFASYDASDRQCLSHPPELTHLPPL